MSSTWAMRSVDRVPRHAVQLAVEAQVLLGGQVRVEGRVLEDQADVAADLVALGDDVVAGDRARAAGRAGRACRAC